MLSKLVVAVVVEAFDGRLLDRPVHALNLPVGPRVVRFGQSMVDIVLGARQFEGMAAELFIVCQHSPDVQRRPSIDGRIGEVRSVVG